jgi:hypothetical protein
MIVDATMIVGVLFVEAIGKSFRLRGERAMGIWMALWGYISLLPFSVSVLLALLEFNSVAIFACGLGFVGFTMWFLLVTTAFAKAPANQIQYIVQLNELDDYLKRGYSVVLDLKDGRIVVES